MSDTAQNDVSLYVNSTRCRDSRSLPTVAFIDRLASVCLNNTGIERIIQARVAVESEEVDDLAGSP